MFFEKKEAIFYEKPGCMGNKKQKELLWSHGITLQVKSILDEPWTKERLQSFFGDLPNDKMINQFAPQVKTGEIQVDALSQEQLIDLMIENPILIKRPLLEIKEEKMVGFDKSLLQKVLNISFEDNKQLNTCQSEKCDSL